MAGIEFVATSARYYTSVGEYQNSAPGLSYGVRLADGEAMELATGENFKELEGNVSLRTSATSVPLHVKQVGTFHYFEGHADPFEPSGPSYIVEVVVTAQQLNDLLVAARTGRIPSQIFVHVENMEYDWRPDGSGRSGITRRTGW